MPSAKVRILFALFAVGFGTNVATPLFLIYEDRLGLSTWTLTALFAIYPIGLAPALVFSGPASDVLGRRVVIMPGVLLSGVASLVMLFGGDTVVMLYIGRFLLGVVSGVVFVVASAWMQEVGSENPLLTSRQLGAVMYIGFGAGPMVSGVIGQWGPAPLVIPYVAHIVLIAAGAALLLGAPETVARDSSRRIRPNLGMPRESVKDFVTVVAPTALGVFGMPSLVFGLFPVLLKPAMPGIAVLISGALGFIATWSILPAQSLVGRVGPYRGAPIALACGATGTTLGSIAFATDKWGLVLVAAVFMGSASGLAMTSGLRFVDIICRPEDRGALNGSFYAVAYAGMMMPLVVSSLKKSVGSYVPILAGVAIVTAAGSLWLIGAASRLRQRHEAVAAT
ncbi:MAG: MFS transporter [Actinomycetota bacterium]|nr:MFS transporter [Actinomycetota bacterium]